VDGSLWARCAQALETELPESQFNTWVRPLQSLEGAGTLKLLAPNPYVVDWVTRNLMTRIGELVGREAGGDPPVVTIEVGSRPVESPPQRGPGHQWPAQPRLDLRELRRRQEQPARQGRRTAGR